MHQNIEIALMETQSRLQSIQYLIQGRRFTFQKDNDPKYTAKTTPDTCGQLCECSRVTQPEPWLEPYRNISGETWKWLSTEGPHPTWPS